MTERSVNARRNWKAEVFPYDYYTVEPGKECQYCLTEKQAELLRGLLTPVGWITRWWSESEETVKQDTVSQFRDDLIRRLMMSCCGGDFEIIYRWTEDGVLQSSEDGGETWTDDPQNDPRNSSTVFPPTPGEPTLDKKCIAALGMVALIREGIGDNLTDDMGRYTLAQLVTDWVKNYLQTSNPFEALLQIVANQIFTLGVSLLSAALTDEVYRKLGCILYDNMSEDLSFTEDQWEQVRSDILDQISGIAGIFLEHIIFLLGVVGLTNLARSQAENEGTADDCDCTVYKRVYVSPGGGTEVSWDGVWLTFEGVNVGSFYTSFIQTTPDTDTLDVNNCGRYEVEVISGSASVSDSSYRPCGGGSFVPIGLTPLDDICTSQLSIRNLENVPFQLRARAIDCP